MEETRWGIDIKTAECIKFKYKGAGGNLNNFPTESACKDHSKHIKMYNKFSSDI